jgi:hypothetical protein
VTKKTPAFMMRADADTRTRVNKRVYQKKVAKLAKSKLPKIVVGDKVRISLLRRQKDQGLGHIDQPEPNYGTKLHIVEKITTHRHNPKYHLQNLKLFRFREELQLVRQYDPSSKTGYRDRPKLSDDFDPEYHVKVTLPRERRAAPKRKTTPAPPPLRKRSTRTGRGQRKPRLYSKFT